MFGFLKDKLKSALNVFSKKVDEEGETEEVTKEVEKPKKEKPTPKKTEKVPVSEADKKPEKKAKEKKSQEETKKTEEIKDSSKKKTEEISQEEIVEETPEKTQEKPKKISEAKFEETTEKETIEEISEKEEPEKIEEVISEKKTEEISQEEVIEETPEEPKKSFFQRITEKITTKKISVDKFEELFTDLELLLYENNVSLEVVDKIKEDLKKELVDKPLPRGEIIETITKTLQKSISELFEVPTFDILEKIKDKKPLVIAFIGVNGSGKTTQLAKVAHLLKKHKKTSVIAACDTFRAAAIQQLGAHAEKLDIKMITHDYGADPAAVAYDAIEHAKARGIDVVLIDTAGRLHSNSNLMDELKKIVRVAKPDITVFVGESITGNDCVEQAVQFGNAIPIDGIILTKADVDEKGGAAISISYVTGKPILFLGTGQEYDDLEVFDKEYIMKNIGL